MATIVAGMTPIGIEVAAALADRGRELTVIDSDKLRLRNAEERLDAMLMEADEATMDTLRRVRADSAELVVFATPVDELNLFGAAAARKMGAKRSLAMVRNVGHLDGAPGIARDLHDVDYVLCPVMLTAMEAHRMAHANRVIRQSQLADNRITVEEIAISPDDPVAGTTIDRLGLPDSVRIMAIVRDGTWVPAGVRERIQVGDRVIIMGRRGAIASAERRFHPGGYRAPRNVFLVGGGRIGLFVGRAFLAEGASVTIMDRDRARCERRSIDLPEATILQGDGTDISLLKQEGVATADVVVGGTADDETNLVVSLLSMRVGTPHTVTLVHRTRNLEVYGHLDLPATVSRPMVVANQAVRLAQRGDSMDVVEVSDGLLHAVEIVVEPGSSLDGRAVRDAGFPPDVMPGFQLKGPDVLPVELSTELSGGDHLILLAPASNQNAIKRLTRAGKGSSIL